MELLRERAADVARTIGELWASEANLSQLVSRAEHLSPSDCDLRGVCHLVGATD